MVIGQNIRVVEVSYNFERREFGVLCQQGGGSKMRAKGKDVVHEDKRDERNGYSSFLALLCLVPFVKHKGL